MGLAAVVFFGMLALTYAAALYARLHAGSERKDEDLAGRSLNRWLVGLSAGTTGNSGFIVTAGVGLGYSGGVHWLMLPLSWLVGDLIFWRLFPHRLNRAARQAKATTISELLTAGLKGRAAAIIPIVAGALLVVFLATYTSAQWLAGEKFLSGVFDLSHGSALLAFGLAIVLYSSLGGFRGSIYTDTIQAGIRILGTVIALGAVIWLARANPGQFSANIAAAGPDFLSPFPNLGILGAIGFVGGYAAAAVGFGLGQPQMVTRYLAGSSPEETRSAQWIYIGFLQGTWLAMTLFGILLRGVMPGLGDPETGLSVFVQQHLGAVATGVIFADVFATIASTSNGILVAVGQTIRHDFLGRTLKGLEESPWVVNSTTLVVGLITIGLSFVLPGNVFSIAVDAVSKVGAGLAGPVMIRLFGWRCTAVSLLAAMVAGVAAAFAWKSLGLSGTVNEAGIGIAVSLVVNAAVAALSSRAPVPADTPAAGC